jgi:ketosteroid isomerase-like protein
MAQSIEDPELNERVNRLLQAYADGIDRADCDAVAALFAADGRWEHAAGVVLIGRVAILRHLQEGIAQFTHAHHHVGPALLARLPDSSLQSTAYFIATHVLQGGHSYTVWGRYLDRIAEGPQLAISLRQMVVHLTEGTEREYRMLQRVTLSD